MRRARLVRPIVAAWVISMLLAALNVALALADSGGNPFPR
jgi:hypothetical protein